MVNPPQSYGHHLPCVITVLPVTRHRWKHPPNHSQKG